MKIIKIILITVLISSCTPHIEELYEAIKSNDSSQVEKLVKRGVDLQNKNILKSAIKVGDVNTIRILLDSGCLFEIDKADLEILIESDRVDLIILLLEYGLDPYIQAGFNLTLINWAINNQEGELFKKMISTGLDINGFIGNTYIFHYALRNFNLDVVKYMVSNGADLDYKNEYEETALSIALGDRNTDIAKFLIESGADIRLSGDDYHNPWESLVDYWGHGYIEVAEIFWEKGLRFEYEDDESLHAAVLYHNYEFVDWLLDHGADPLARDSAGMLPIDYTHAILKNYAQNYDITVMSRAERNKKANELSDKLKKYEMK